MNKEPERNPRKALGKGLSALLPSRPPQIQEHHSSGPHSGFQPSEVKTDLPAEFHSFENIPLDQIEPGDQQPRESFDREKLEELAQSIRTNGLIQPITVQKIETGKYRIIAGERRWRAAGIAGLEKIPALVRQVEDANRLQMALIENIQREDLNPMEIAVAFYHLSKDHGLSHEEIAQRTGKDRTTITNFIRLLRLDAAVRQALIEGKISMGHARALLNLFHPDRQIHACREIIEKGMSVRQTEALVKRLTEEEKADMKAVVAEKDVREQDPNVKAAIEEMSRALGTRVRLVARSLTSGKIELEYYSQEDLDRIYSVIVKQ